MIIERFGLRDRKEGRGDNGEGKEVKGEWGKEERRNSGELQRIKNIGNRGKRFGQQVE